MLQTLFIFLFGSIIGSFLNVCIYRLPERISLIAPPSSCPHCKKRIPHWANIPILGYIILRGRCHYCLSKISIRYPLIELSTGLLTVLSFYHFGFTLQFFVYSVFIYFLIVIAFIDIKTHLIFNNVLIAFFAIGLLARFFVPFISWSNALFGVLTGGLSMLLVSALGKALFKKESMGMGDVKLVAVAGFFVGWKSVLISVYLGFIFAFMLIIILIRVNKIEKGDVIPFGPFIAIGMIVFLFWGNEIIQFYLSLVY